MDRPHSQPVHDWISPASRKAGHGADAFDHRAALDAMTAGLGPMKAIALTQMEMITLASRRTQAFLAVPQRLARCRSREDLVNEQMGFWQTSFEQYQESTMRIMKAWSDAFGLPANPFAMGNGFGVGMTRSQGAEPQPDTSGLIQLPVGGRKSGSSDVQMPRPQRRHPE